jgi:hypothetical protein
VNVEWTNEVSVLVLCSERRTVNAQAVSSSLPRAVREATSESEVCTLSTAEPCKKYITVLYQRRIDRTAGRQLCMPSFHAEVCYYSGG